MKPVPFNAAQGEGPMPTNSTARKEFDTSKLRFPQKPCFRGDDEEFESYDDRPCGAPTGPVTHVPFAAEVHQVDRDGVNEETITRPDTPQSKLWLYVISPGRKLPDGSNPSPQEISACPHHKAGHGCSLRMIPGRR